MATRDPSIPAAGNAAAGEPPLVDDDALIDGRFQERQLLQLAFRQPSDGFEVVQQRLSRCIEQVDRRLRDLVEAHHGELISTAVAVGEVQQDVAQIASTAQSIASSAARLRHTVGEPYLALQQRVSELQAGTLALDYVRRVQRFVVLKTKLHEAVASTDLMRTSRVTRDLEDLLAEKDLSGIEAVDADMPFVLSTATKVRSSAFELFRASLSNSHQGDLTVALQSMHTLGTAGRSVAAVIAEHKRDALKTIVKDLDSQMLCRLAEGGASDPTARLTGADADKAAKEALFQRIESVLSRIVHHASSMLLLWRSLTRKRDPITQALFIDAIHGGPHVGGGGGSFAAAPSFQATGSVASAGGPVLDGAALVVKQLDDLWSAIATHIRDQLGKAVKRGVVQAAVVAEFPRYVRTLRVFAEGIHELAVDVVSRFSSLLLGSATPYGCSMSFEALIASQPSTYNSASICLATDGNDPPATVRWIHDLIADVEERFMAKATEKYQEKITLVKSKISTACPQPGTETVVVVDNAPRSAPNSAGSLASQLTQTIDVRPVTKLIAQDLSTHRHEKTSLDASLKCACVAAEAMHAKLQEGLSKVPQAAVPSLASLTIGLAYAMSVANAAASAASASGGALALLPTAAGAMPGARQQQGGCSIDLACSLRDTCSKFLAITDKVVAPLYASTEAALSHHLDALLAEYDAEAAAAGPTAPPRAMDALKERAAQIGSRMLSLVDRRRSEQLDQQARGIASAVICRFLARVACLRPCGLALSQRVAADALTLVKTIDGLFGAASSTGGTGGAAPSTAAGSGQSSVTPRRLGQMRALRLLVPSASVPELPPVMPDVRAACDRLPPLMVLVLVFNRFVEVSAAPSLHSMLRLSAQDFAARLETLLRLQDGRRPAASPPPELSTMAFNDIVDHQLFKALPEKHQARPALLELRKLTE